MKLKEKLNERLSSAFANEIEQLTDEFAIGFAEFCSKYREKNRNIYEEMLHAKSKYDDTYTTKQLLEIYKKEKPKETDKCQYCGLENGNHKLSCPVIKITMIL